MPKVPLSFWPHGHTGRLEILGDFLFFSCSERESGDGGDDGSTEGEVGGASLSADFSPSPSALDSVGGGPVGVCSNGGILESIACSLVITSCGRRECRAAGGVQSNSHGVGGDGSVRVGAAPFLGSSIQGAIPSSLRGGPVSSIAQILSLQSGDDQAASLSRGEGSNEGKSDFGSHL